MPHARIAPSRHEGLFSLALESIAFALAAVGVLHVAVLATFDINLFAEAFRAGPVAVASLQGVLALATCYVIALAIGRRN